MDLTVAQFALALGLGLFGFIEPCTIGAHLLFLDAQRDRSLSKRARAMGIFLTARVLVMGGFGGLIVLAGQRLLGVQTGLWLLFGLVYLAIGLVFLTGGGGALSRRIRIAPEAWKSAQSPVVQGAAFGLNIPACAAPILFGLLGAATTTGSAATGFAMMAVFALALSAPLLPLSLVPALAGPLGRLRDRMRPRRWLIGAVFIGLGLWSVWFGLFVDPADWVGP
jgi:cytochrome c-type biogenesis protein